jgi:hypothetical protein
MLGELGGVEKSYWSEPAELTSEPGVMAPAVVEMTSCKLQTSVSALASPLPDGLAAIVSVLGWMSCAS